MARHSLLYSSMKILEMLKLFRANLTQRRAERQIEATTLYVDLGKVNR